MKLKEYLVEYLEEVANNRGINLSEAERKDIVEQMFAEQHNAFDSRLNAFLEVVEERFDDIQNEDDDEPGEMTDEEDDAVDDFLAAGDFVAPNAVNHSGSNFEYVWEDFLAAEAFHLANPNMHVYTAIGDMDYCEIVVGKHHVNRYGYLFSKKDAGLPHNQSLRIR